MWNMKMKNIKDISRFFGTKKNQEKVAFNCVESVIGLEIHAQLKTKTKLFSAARLDQSASSNSIVADFDLGVPGTLPRINRQCVQKSLLAAILLKSDIQQVCRFDRKHYFYPDMPMGYQITQNDYPVARGGSFEFFPCKSTASDPFEKKTVRIKQIQLEMDSGKTIKGNSNNLYVDLNRAGIGLVEIVTEPDFSSSSEAASFVDQLRLLLAHNQICAGELHMGNMRVDANISLRVNGQNYPRTEIKNVNSIRLLKDAIDNELKRQKTLLNTGEEIRTVTLSLDDNGGSVVMREKGDSLDYRFTPEPNLPRLKIETEWVSQAKAVASTDPDHLIYVNKFGINPSHAIEIVKDDRRHNFIKATLSKSKVPITVYFEWFKQLQFACEHVNKQFPPNDESFLIHFVDLVNAYHMEKITKLSCIELLKFYLQDNIHEPVSQMILNNKYKRLKTDDDEFHTLLDSILKENPGVCEKFKTSSGNAKQKAFNKLRNALITKAGKRIAVSDAESALKNAFEL